MTIHVTLFKFQINYESVYAYVLTNNTKLGY